MSLEKSCNSNAPKKRARVIAYCTFLKSDVMGIQACTCVRDCDFRHRICDACMALEILATMSTLNDQSKYKGIFASSVAP